MTCLACGFESFVYKESNGEHLANCWNVVGQFRVCGNCQLVYFNTMTDAPKAPRSQLKQAYGQAGLVRLTAKEYGGLVEKYGEAQTAAIIEKLDSYKLAKGRKYRSDIGAIRQWVIESVGATPVEKPKAYKAITLGLA